MRSSLPNLLPEKHAVLMAATEALRHAPNVVAVVLGGSHASGYAGPQSDLDIGIYYRESAPLVIPSIRAIADALSKPASPPVVTELYGWGPWVNGGAWIQTPATKVDFVYRNLDQLDRVIAEGRAGIWRHDFDQQPPYGFRSVVYFGETHCCVPLHDPEGAIAALKQQVAVYPEKLREAILRDGLWGTEFTLWSAEGFAAAGDVYNAVGCLTRAAQYLVHGLFALNNEYFLNDKHVNRTLARLPKVPGDCTTRLAAALASPGQTEHELRRSAEQLRELWAEAVALTAGAYHPRFNLTAAR